MAGPCLAGREARRVRLRPRSREQQRRGHLGARACRPGRDRRSPIDPRDPHAGRRKPSGMGRRQRARRLRGVAWRRARRLGVRGAVRGRASCNASRGAVAAVAAAKRPAGVVSGSGDASATRHGGVPAWSPDGQTLAHRHVRDRHRRLQRQPPAKRRRPADGARGRVAVRAVARAGAARDRRGRRHGQPARRPMPDAGRRRSTRSGRR